ncbi:MAG: TIGR03668 family PPOX class F420-dependent oxidoreductase [Candidatus Xenobia bacterium]
MLTPEIRALLGGARTAQLATADASGQPACVPVCFALAGDDIVIALDDKPKRVPVTELKRVRNILANPAVAFLIDHYEEDWSRLWYLLIRGTASIEPASDPALALLREKYPQYRSMALETRPLIRIQPTAARLWSAGSLT